MNLSFRQIFLIDGIGALLTAIMLGLVLASFEPFFGMPVGVLHFLSGLAFAFSLYSFGCYLRLKDNWQFFMKAIAILNLGYCILSLGLVIYHFQKLSVWGILYFALEIVVIVVLANMELKTAAGGQKVE